MTTETKTSLTELEYIPYIDADGQLPEGFQSQVGVYAIFDSDRVLQFVGYSRDVFLSLKQHLVRQPEKCQWLKVQTISRPSRTILESIKEAWTAENGSIPPGNAATTQWTEPIDAKLAMTVDEQISYEASDELTQIKLLKSIARRVEATVISNLESRGIRVAIRFNPKLKEKGILDLT
ncbi:GIY-YIG nuclease family protein [Gloeocapsopsis dulcis]|uniref:Nuclease subunit of the excinuclease complex n=1 Tax=Gloeocapsopsis dulcis AAB1 = 1H9 TaxID=1433147 RepID=A0A6N8FXZ9_9CHRO|nr:GIY-YIG nuclease family protein [Gloeocapsopsis dulcis]MUL37017.1 Nuclease subunit of the excinuclease complex [Gloeocapsopsis dulcis AAB1 = 1H9]WNN87870.1 GIY-YIG nuclease family protein [Gloeocapsopsis dulcis]